MALSSAAAIGARDMNAESMTKLHSAYKGIVHKANRAYTNIDRIHWQPRSSTLFNHRDSYLGIIDTEQSTPS